MKTSTNSTVIERLIDIQLKALLQADLQRFKSNKENTQAPVKNAA
jgi:uncharacterized membrane protein